MRYTKRRAPRQRGSCHLDELNWNSDVIQGQETMAMGRTGQQI